MGDLYNQFTGTTEKQPLSENPSKLDVAMQESQKTDAVKASRVLDMAKITGLPQDIIATHLDDIEAQASAPNFDSDKFRTESPIVAGWMAQSPEHSAILKEEAPMWGGLERTIASATKSWENEQDQAERNRLLLKELQGESLSPEEAARRDKLFGDIKYRAEQSSAETTSEYLARTNASGVFQMASSMRASIRGAAEGGTTLGTLGFATGGPAGAATGLAFGTTGGAMMAGGVYSYNQEAPMMFDDLRNMKDVNGDKMDEGTARNVSKVTGVLLATVEVASGAVVASMIAPLRSIIGKATGGEAAKQAIRKQVELAMKNPTTAAMVKHAVAGFLAAPSMEALEEFTQALISAGGREVAQGLTDQYFPPDSFSEDMQSATQQAKDAFFGSLLPMGAPVAGSRMYHGMREVKAAKQAEAYYKSLGEAVTESKAAKLAPEQVQDVVEQITDNGPIKEVYIDATQWKTYFQNKNLDPKEAARQVLGDTQEYDNAIASDSSIRIPIGDYATKIAGTEHNVFFQKEIRRAPDAMNVREAEDMQKEIEAEVKQSTEGIQKVRDEVTAKLVALGYEQSTAATMAAQTHEWFASQAQRLGITDPMALFQRYGINIQRGTDQVQPEDQKVYNQKDNESNVIDFQKAKDEVQLKEFHKELGSRISVGVQKMVERINAYAGWKFDVGQRIRSIKTGRIYEVTARSWDMKNNRPMYNYKGEAQAGTFIADKAHDAFEVMTGPERIFFQKKAEYLAGLLGENLTNRYENDRGVNSAIDVRGEKVTALEILSFMKAQVGNQYLDWAARKYVNGDFLLEDVGRVGDYLQRWDAVKRAMPNKDINQFKTLIALEEKVEILEEAGVEPTSKEQQRKEQEKARAESTMVFENPRLKIITPHTVFASQYYGRGTRWCTASKNNNLFENYNKDGPLFIVMTDDGQKYQFHFESQQFMDSQDASMYGEAEGEASFGLNNLVYIYPDLKVVFGDKAKMYGIFPLMKTEDLHDVAVQKNAVYEQGEYAVSGLQRALGSLPPETQRWIVQHDSHLIGWIEGPTEIAQILAVERNPEVIDSIYLPAEQTQLSALKTAIEIDKTSYVPQDSEDKWDPSNSAVRNVIASLADGVSLGQVEEFSSVTELMRQIKSTDDWMRDNRHLYGGYDELVPDHFRRFNQIKSQALQDLQISLIQEQKGVSREEAVSLYHEGVRIDPDSKQEYEQKYQESKDDTLGYMTIGPDKKISINMMENADLSTYLHESGHMYLEILADLTSETGWERVKKFLGQELEDGVGRAELKADADIITQWLGADNLSNLTVEQHERFARGIEAYFMEGRAPSVELRPVFARFRAWMVALYKTIKNLNVKLNPEVRAVFDRMFATQEAIDAAKAEAEVIPMFATAQEAGMSETEFSAYTKFVADVSARAQDELQQKIMKQMQRAQEAEWARRRNEIRDQVAEQISSEREYQVLSFLSEPDNKLARSVLIDLYPDPYKDNMVMQALHSMDVYRSKEGLDPQAVAEDHGYSSADEMLRALIETTPYKERVEQETDIRMKELYGDILTDGTMADEARKQVLGPGRSEVLLIELKAIRKRQRMAQPMVSSVVREARADRVEGMAQLQTSTPSLAFVRQVAEGTIAQMRMSTLNANTYLIASRNAAKAARAAIHKGDYHIAAYHVQKELLNTELYRETQRVKTEAEKMRKFMATFEDSKVRERIAKAGDFYLEQIDALNERFNFSRMTTKEANKRKNLAQWVEEQKAAGVEVNLSDEIINEAYRKPWKDMTFDELSNVVDAAKHIKHLAILKNKLLKSKANRELNATINLIDETMAINARHQDTRQRETRLPQEQAANAFASFLGAHRKIASLAREMDGFVDGGPVWESIIWPLNDAASSEAMMHEKSNEKLRALFKRYTHFTEQSKTLATSISGGLFQAGIYKQEHIPEINGSLSKVGRIMVALNWGNESNRQRIMDGYAWTDAQVEAILAPLTKDDWDFVQGIWDHFESFWPEVEALAKRVDGVAPKKVPASVVLTPHGEYRGGYFPLMYDDRQSPKAFAHLAKEAADRAMHGAAVRLSTAHGERINRVNNVKMPVRLDFGVITEALSETIHDITHYETLIDLNRIIGNKRIQTAMVSHFGYESYQQFRSALRDVAGGDIPAQTQVDKSLNWLRKGTTIVGMGWNVITGLMQPLGVTQSWVRIGVVPVAKGLGRWLGDAARMENTVKWIYSKSPIMQERSITQSREINEIRNQISPTGLLTPMQDSYFYLIVKLQQMVDVPTWLGAYEKGMEQFKDDFKTVEELEAKAIATADQAVLDSQGGGQIKDRAAVQRGGPAQMLWTNFYSYFNTTFNLTAESYRKTKFTNPYEAGRFAVDMLLLYTLPAFLSMAMRDLLRGEWEDDPDKLMRKLLQNQLSYLVGPVLLAREIGGTLQGFYGYEGPAGARFFAQSAKLAKQVQQGKADQAMWRALNQTAGILFHYPAGQVQRIIEGMAYDMEQGTPNPLPPLVGPPHK